MEALAEAQLREGNHHAARELVAQTLEMRIAYRTLRAFGVTELAEIAAAWAISRPPRGA